MKVYYTDTFSFPLPEGHRFPVGKYKRLRDRLERRAEELGLAFLVPEAATDAQLRLVHTESYIRSVIEGTLDARQIRRIGLPWSVELVERSRRSVGATIAASREALRSGIAVSLAGGTHHAFADHGEGFCVFNDIAVAAALLQSEGLAQQIAIVDADVHQGNGTAAIFHEDPTVYTLSIHGEKNFPFRKFSGDLDIGLPDGISDTAYLTEFRKALNAAFDEVDPGFVFYLAGADPHQNDRMGRLSLSIRGLADRDRMMFDLCLKQRLPVTVVLAGGYGRNLEDTVTIHAETVRLASNFYKKLRVQERKPEESR